MKATQHVEASTHLPGQELTAFLWAEWPPAQAPACLRSQSKTRGQTNGSSSDITGDHWFGANSADPVLNNWGWPWLMRLWTGDAVDTGKFREVERMV